MSNYKLRYFIAQGQNAYEIAKKGFDQIKDRDAIRSEFLNEVGAIGFYESTYFSPNALVFDTDEKHPGLIYLSTDSSTGKPLYAFKPDLRTKIGKSIAQRLKTLSKFNFSEYAVDAYKVKHCTIIPNGHGMAMVMSVAGYYQDHMVFKIPFGGYQGEREVIDVEIPSDFREISESQFIAFTREGKPLDQLAA